MSDNITINPTWQLPRGFHFTQSNLQDFLDCQRRFYLRHIEQQGWPSPLAEPQDAVEEALKQGAWFHQLVERHQHGVPLDVLTQGLADDSPMLDWLDYYQQTLADVGPFKQQWVETRLSTTVSDFPVLAKFDFVGVRDTALTGIDWKTGRLPAAPQLAERMQTIVYLLVLYREGARLAGRELESIELVYVGVQERRQLRFTVDQDKVRRFERQIAAAIESVREATNFPLVEDEQVCRFCVYRGLCERGTSPILPEVASLDLDDLFLGYDAEDPEAYEF